MDESENFPAGQPSPSNPFDELGGEDFNDAMAAVDLAADGAEEHPYVRALRQVGADDDLIASAQESIAQKNAEDDEIVVTSPEARFYPRWPLWRRFGLVAAALYVVFSFWAFQVVLIGWWRP